MKNIFLGTFNVASGRLMVSDPCYERDVWCMGIIQNVMNGEWDASIEVDKVPDWGERVHRLYATHTAYPADVMGEWSEADFQVGVDSGQAGIFDEALYPQGDTGEYGDLDTFYGRACAATHDEKDQNKHGGVIKEGVVSSTGFGDGSYTCRVYRDQNGVCTVVSITFIEDEDEDEEES